jgi:hypothetical protein
VIINIRTALAASGTATPLSGSVFEFVTEPSLIEIGIAADANGVLATINSGPDTIAEESPVSFKAINVLPVYPDDFYSDEALPNDRLSIKLRDTSAAARVVMTQVRITPL